jgi:hypothetical protein
MTRIVSVRVAPTWQPSPRNSSVDLPGRILPGWGQLSSFSRILVRAEVAEETLAFAIIRKLLRWPIPGARSCTAGPSHKSSHSQGRSVVSLSAAMTSVGMSKALISLSNAIIYPWGRSPMGHENGPGADPHRCTCPSPHTPPKCPTHPGAGSRTRNYPGSGPIPAPAPTPVHVPYVPFVLCSESGWGATPARVLGHVRDRGHAQRRTLCTLRTLVRGHARVHYCGPESDSVSVPRSGRAKEPTQHRTTCPVAGWRLRACSRSSVSLGGCAEARLATA